MEFWDYWVSGYRHHVKRWCLYLIPRNYPIFIYLSSYIYLKNAPGACGFELPHLQMNHLMHRGPRVNQSGTCIIGYSFPSYWNTGIWKAALGLVAK